MHLLVDFLAFVHVGALVGEVGFDFANSEEGSLPQNLGSVLKRRSERYLLFSRRISLLILMNRSISSAEPLGSSSETAFCRNASVELQVPRSELFRENLEPKARRRLGGGWVLCINDWYGVRRDVPGERE